MKKIACFIMTVLIACTAFCSNAITAPASTDPYFYLYPGVWNKDYATFSVWSWDFTDGTKDRATELRYRKDDNGLYVIDKADLGKHVVFVRVAYGKEFNGNFSKDVVWNQSEVLEVPTDGRNCYVVTGMNRKDGYWTTHIPYEPITVTTAATTEATTEPTTEAPTDPPHRADHTSYRKSHLL